MNADFAERAYSTVSNLILAFLFIAVSFDLRYL